MEVCMLCCKLRALLCTPMGESRLPGNLLDVGIAHFYVAKGPALVEGQFGFISEAANHGSILTEGVF